jgi:hypothetical protein
MPDSLGGHIGSSTRRSDSPINRQIARSPILDDTGGFIRPLGAKPEFPTVVEPGPVSTEFAALIFGFVWLLALRLIGYIRRLVNFEGGASVFVAIGCIGLVIGGVAALAILDSGGLEAHILAF